MKKQSYDVIIIGCGTAGIFAGYELNKIIPDADILMLEQETIFIVGVVQL